MANLRFLASLMLVLNFFALFFFKWFWNHFSPRHVVRTRTSGRCRRPPAPPSSRRSGRGTSRQCAARWGWSGCPARASWPCRCWPAGGRWLGSSSACSRLTPPPVESSARSRSTGGSWWRSLSSRWAWTALGGLGRSLVGCTRNPGPLTSVKKKKKIRQKEKEIISFDDEAIPEESW